MKQALKALRRAVQVAGGATKLAAQLKITPEAVMQWQLCPILRVLEVERITGVSRQELRPDVYPEVILTDSDTLATHAEKLGQ